MNVKRIGSVLMVGLVLLSAVVVLVGTVAATERWPIRFGGHLTDAEGKDLWPAHVQITRGDFIWSADTFGDGTYVTEYIWDNKADSKAGQYDMYIGTEHVQTRNIKEDEFVEETCRWICQWDREVQIPEFSTIAIPVASILGLLFFFNRRKHRKE